MNLRLTLSAVATLVLVACGGPQQDTPASDKATTQGQSLILGGEPCGSKTCGSGQFCCNASCGICAPMGGSCTQQVCATESVMDTTSGDTAGQACGANTCGASEFCCNESCGICAPKGGSCTQQVCGTTSLKEIPGDAPVVTCGSNTCGAGEFCCNESCGICAPKGGSCTQQYCPPAS